MTGKYGKDDDFLKILGLRVCAARTLQGLSRKTLALTSDVSERYIAQLECGRGNISILLLRRISSALMVPLANLIETDIVTGGRQEDRVDNIRRQPGM